MTRLHRITVIRINKITISTKTERKTKLENIIKVIKCGIAVLLTLCILLDIAGIRLNVTAMPEEATVGMGRPAAL